MDYFVVVLITAGSKEEADRIGRTLVEEKLAACTNTVHPINSVFTWKGKMYEEGEALLIVKSVKHKLDELIYHVKKLHSYEVPEIIALPIVGGSREYLAWVEEETRKPE